MKLMAFFFIKKIDMVTGTASGRYETVLRSSHLPARRWRQSSKQIFLFVLLIGVLLLLLFFLFVALQGNAGCLRLLVQNPLHQVIHWLLVNDRRYVTISVKNLRN